MFHRRRIVICMLSVVLTMPFLYGTDTARLSGIIQDQSRAVVPNAKVILTNEATGLRKEAPVSDMGEYVFLAVPIGSYRLEVEAAGFRKYIQTGIVLTVNQSARNDIALAMGSLSQEITVQGNAGMVDTDISEVKYHVDQARIENIPLAGRNILALASLMPGVISGNVVQGAGQGTQIFVNGNRHGDTSFNLDGADVRDEQNDHNPNRLPPPDSVQEFTMLTNSFKAEYGSSGAVINAVTKSGTNSLHGSAWEFLRNNRLNARNYFAGPSADKYQYNQFGAALGGPVIKDKLFFFISYEGFRGRLGNSPLRSRVPTAAERAGDLSDVATPVIDPNTGQPFPGNIIPSERLDPTAQSVLSNFVPQPNASDGQFIWTFPMHDSYDQGLFKVDYNINSKSRLTVRGLYTPGGTLQSFTALPGVYRAIDRPTSNLTVSHLYSFTPTSLNEFRATVQRGLLIQHLSQTNPISPEDVGFNFVQVPDQNLLPQTSVSGYFSIGTFRGDQRNVQAQKYIFEDSQTLIRGRHTIKFGGEYRHGRTGAAGAYGANGSYSFSGSLTGNALGDYLLGLPTSFGQQTPIVWEVSNYGVSTYVQDDYKVTPRFTLNLGLRLQVAAMPKEKEGQFDFYVPENFAKGIRSTVFPTLPQGILVAGDPGVPERAGYTHWAQVGNLAPRFGFAYDVLGNGKTVVRGGFGIFGLPVDNQWVADTVYTPPYVLAVNMSYPSSYSNPYQGGVNPFETWQPKTPYDLSTIYPLYVFPNTVDYRDGYTEQWNVSFERQFGSDLSVSATYLGIHSLALTNYGPVNNPVYTPGNDANGDPLSTVGNEDARRPWAPFYTSILLFKTDASRYSNQMQLKVQKRARNLTLLAHYTLSKTMSWCDNPDFGCGNQDPDHPQLDFSATSNDVRHRGVVSWVYNLPKFTANRAAGLLLNGWLLSGAVTVQSGMPLNVVTGIDNSLTGNYTDRPDVVGDWNLSGGRSKSEKIAKYFNVDAFALNQIGQFGNLPHNALRGPGFLGNDVGLFKKFSLTERQNLEFRAEAFNLLNYTNLGPPDTAVTSPTFGQVLSAGNARIVQFGMKYLF
jgi:hypothetical protein